MKLGIDRSSVNFGFITDGLALDVATFLDKN